MCTKRAGSGGEDAESESGRLRTQERQIGLMNVGLRTGLRAGIESKKLRAEGAVYKSERLIITWGSEHHAESAGVRVGD